MLLSSVSDELSQCKQKMLLLEDENKHVSARAEELSATNKSLSAASSCKEQSLCAELAVARDECVRLESELAASRQQLVDLESSSAKSLQERIELSNSTHSERLLAAEVSE